MADEKLPPDPEAERQALLLREFLDLGFTQTEAACLAYNWASPQQVSWWLQQGATHKQCVEIAT